MTQLQEMYAEARARTRGHHAALRIVAAQTGLDGGTIERVLDRAADDRPPRPLQASHSNHKPKRTPRL